VTESLSPWFTGPYGLVWADRTPLPFTSCKGHQKLFDVPDEVVRKLGLGGGR